MPLRFNGTLGTTFLACRGLQFIFLILIMGITANLVSTFANSSQKPPNTLIGVLSITCFTTLYTLLSSALYYDTQLPHPYSGISDVLFLTSLLTTSIVLSKPLSHLSCRAVGIYANAAAASAEAENPSYINEGYHAVRRAEIYVRPPTYAEWVSGTERACELMKAVWGLVIVVAILFAASTVCLAFMWRKENEKRPQGKPQREHYAVHV